jgi:hypothetical protein
VSDEAKPALTKPPKLVEHYCEHEGCKAWGSHGYDVNKVTKWFCYEHRWLDYRSSYSGGRR